jgi:hypothetical protein
MPSFEYLRKRAELYWRLSLVICDDDLRRIVTERAQRFTAEVESLETTSSACEPADENEILPI